MRHRLQHGGRHRRTLIHFTRDTGLLIGALVVVALGLVDCGGATAVSKPGEVTPPTSSGSPPPPPVPTSSIYLGAWINPNHIGTTSPGSQELEQLPSFEHAVHGIPGILHVYVKESPYPPVAALTSISSAGAVPMLDWKCSPVTQVVSGSLDPEIRVWAQRLRQYGKPVFLRWFWEMNLPDKGTAACLGKEGPAEFVAAWRHIWRIFHQVGASNVAFVWSPGISGAMNPMEPFFPGKAYVNWISVDVYLYRYIVDAHGVTALTRLISPWYKEWSGLHSIPLMISEVGAPPTYQESLFDLVANSFPEDFPDIRGLVYFDAPGVVPWQLDSGGLNGFGSLLSNSYFSFHAS